MQLQTIDASSNHFLSIEASQELLPTVRPDKNSTGTLEESEDQSATTTTIKTDEKSSTTDDNTIATEETRLVATKRYYSCGFQQSICDDPDEVGHPTLLIQNDISEKRAIDGQTEMGVVYRM